MSNNPSTLIQPDPAKRRRFVLVLLLLIAAGAWLTTSFEAYLGSLNYDNPSDLAQMLWIIKAVLALAAISPVVFAGWFFWTAQRVFQAERYPLPGQTVLVATRLKTGREARRLAWKLIVAAVLMLVVAGSLSYASLRVLRLAEKAVAEMSSNVSDSVRLSITSPV